MLCCKTRIINCDEEKNINKLNLHTNDEFGNMAAEIDKQMEIIAKNLDEDNHLI